MAADATPYDLVLLLSSEAPEEQRSKVLKDVEAAIANAGGSITRDDDWGRRTMAYQIRHQPQAEYHLLQFSAPGELIADLSHTLGITDGVLRSRIIKVRPGTPEAPSAPPPVVAPAASSAPAAAAPAESSAPTEAPAAEAPAPAEEASAPAAVEEPEAEPSEQGAEAEQ